MDRLLKQIQNSALAKGSLVLVIGTQVANLFAYLYHLFLGRILGPSGYGELAALLSLLYIITVPSEGLRTVSTKYNSAFFARGKNGQAKSLYLRLIKYICITGILGLLVSVPFYGFLSRYLKISDPANFFWLYLTFAAMLLNSINIGLLFGYQRFVASTVVLNATSLLRLLLGIVCAFFGATAAVMGNAISTLLTYFIYLVPLKFIFRADTERVDISRGSLFSYTVPTTLAVLGLMSLYSTDVVLVKHFFSSYEAGIYSSIAVLGKIIYFASSSVSLILFPIIARKWELKESIDKEFYLSLIAVSGISLALTLVYFLIPQFIVNMLFGPRFSDAAEFLGKFGIFLSLFSLSGLVMNVFLAIGKTIVWIVMITAAFVQYVLIQYYHNSLTDVINVNILICSILFAVLLLYYPYAKKRIS